MTPADLNSIISIGELVWDLFPEQRILGGAPVNVAYHLAALRHEVAVVSRVGRDEAGDAALRGVAALGLSPASIQRDRHLPTGMVLVSMDANNEPRYEIVSPAAWDAIAPHLDGAPPASRAPYHLVFGTLGQRDPRSRATILALRRQAVRSFYDVNLRPPFTTRELVLDSLPGAELVKMNGDELIRISGWLDEPVGDRQKAARRLAARFGISALVVTEGAAGAWLVAGDDFFQHPGFPIEVRDTVGAGDAFFAALIDGYLRGGDWRDILAVANQRGGYVASRAGATPPMP